MSIILELMHDRALGPKSLSGLHSCQVREICATDFRVFIHLEDGHLEQVVELVDTLENVAGALEGHDGHQKEVGSEVCEWQEEVHKLESQFHLVSPVEADLGVVNQTVDVNQVSSSAEDKKVHHDPHSKRRNEHQHRLPYPLVLKVMVLTHLIEHHHKGHVQRDHKYDDEPSKADEPFVIELELKVQNKKYQQKDCCKELEVPL